MCVICLTLPCNCWIGRVGVTESVVCADWAGSGCCLSNNVTSIIYRYSISHIYQYRYEVYLVLVCIHYFFFWIACLGSAFPMLVGFLSEFAFYYNARAERLLLPARSIDRSVDQIYRSVDRIYRSVYRSVYRFFHVCFFSTFAAAAEINGEGASSPRGSNPGPTGSHPTPWWSFTWFGTNYKNLKYDFCFVLFVVKVQRRRGYVGMCAESGEIKASGMYVCVKHATMPCHGLPCHALRYATKGGLSPTSCMHSAEGGVLYTVLGAHGARRTRCKHLDVYQVLHD